MNLNTAPTPLPAAPKWYRGIVLREVCGCGAEIAFSDYILESTRQEQLAQWRKNHEGCRG